MENNFGIPDCTTEDFEQFIAESGLADEAYEFVEITEDDVKREFDPRLEVIVEIYYGSELMLQVDEEGCIIML